MLCNESRRAATDLVYHGSARGIAIKALRRLIGDDLVEIVPNWETFWARTKSMDREPML